MERMQSFGMTLGRNTWLSKLAFGIVLSVSLTARSQEALKSALDYAKDLESSDKSVRREAAYQLSRMDSGVKVAIPQLVKALEDEQQQVWFGAITALARLGPDAEPALPALMAELESWQPFRRDRQGAQGVYRTALALGSIGKPAVPILSNALASDKWHVRAGAARALGFAKTPALPTVPRLVQLLQDERPEVRDAAAEAIAILGPGAIPSLVGILKAAEDPTARAAAASALERMGRSAGSAQADLLGILESEKDVAVKARVVFALSRICPDPAEVLPAIMRAWEHPDTVLQAAAFSALLLIRPVAGVLLPAVLPMLNSEQGEVRARAARLLGELGADAAPAVIPLLRRIEGVGIGQAEPALLTALAGIGEPALPAIFEELRSRPAAELKPDDWPLVVLRQSNISVLSALTHASTNASASIRAGALEALIALGDRARSSAKRLPPLLDDPEAAVRSRAWLAAGACGVAPETIMARLSQGLGDDSLEVQRAVVQAIARLGKSARPAIPRLLEALETKDSALETAAVRALASIGAEAGEAAPALAAKLLRSEVPMQLEILGALAAIGGSAASDLPSYVRLGDSKSREVQIAFLDTVARFQDKGLPALAVVERHLRSPDSTLRAAAIKARVAFEPDSEAAVRVAVEALDDPDVGVRKAAADAIGKLEEKGRPAESKLFTMLSNEGDHALARETLRAIHPTSVPSLLEAMKHSDWKVREMAADALARLGKSAADAVPVLERAVREDSADDVKRASRRALRRIREG